MAGPEPLDVKDKVAALEGLLLGATERLNTVAVAIVTAQYDGTEVDQAMHDGLADAADHLVLLEGQLAAATEEAKAGFEGGDHCIGQVPMAEYDPGVEHDIVGELSSRRAPRPTRRPSTASPTATAAEWLAVPVPPTAALLGHGRTGSCSAPRASWPRRPRAVRRTASAGNSMTPTAGAAGRSTTAPRPLRPLAPATAPSSSPPSRRRSTPPSAWRRTPGAQVGVGRTWHLQVRPTLRKDPGRAPNSVARPFQV
ncbi:unnamed protein product [Prorocentrum cordatum]|uniref:Uncharacterized protein n=1 Tax=Prorocentrum cordatum TaxID=2364126 RepID=A0ABN9SLS5_9DINO|nr:unnamed protein product [Polarella glacialis]